MAGNKGGRDMEDEYVDEEIVENVTDCPSCGEFCGHEVLKEKKAGENIDEHTRNTILLQ